MYVGWVVDRLLRIIEILIFGTGARMELVPGSIREYMKELGIQMDVMDTVGTPGPPCIAHSECAFLEERVFNI